MTWSGSDGDWSTPPPRYDAEAHTAAFGADQRAVEFVEPNTPPMLWLAVSVLLSLAAFVLALVGRGATMGVIAWVLAGPLAITAVALFTSADGKKRESGWYRPSALAEWGRRVAVVLALVAVAFAAWLIASDVARGVWS
ncbi:hypothetical protein [uncultured Tessaracoccus sp.]|uniref:hypothetical protein n=1 Tax=uncultured Tessaracoccus sp. TaxID=905023 RepID=UPI002631E7CB|nr:hypothetical protein [uncultured Tessaracoccus sp.]